MEKGAKKTKNRIYNLVNSVKGGCGKTTLSLWLAAYLSEREQRVCVMDMDLQGSCMVNLIDAVVDAEDITMIENKHRYLNELIRGYQIKDAKFIEDITLKDNIHFSAVFSSPKQSDKYSFYSGARCNYSPIMQYGTFRTGLQNFLKNDKDMKKRDFHHVIFDMPPNSDGYSDAALECVLNNKYSVINRKTDLVNLFMVMTMDSSHLAATINGIKEIYTASNDAIPHRLFIVFNDNIISKTNRESLYKVKKDIMKDAISKFIRTEEQRKNIYFLVMNQNFAYADVCASGVGLVNQACALDSLPFSKYASFYGEDFYIATMDGFDKLIRGEIPDELKKGEEK